MGTVAVEGADLLTFFVRPAFQRQGIGTRLLQAIETVATGNGVQAIEVTPDKRVVWVLQSWASPAALGPATTIQVLDQPSAPEDVHFGPFH